MTAPHTTDPAVDADADVDDTAAAAAAGPAAFVAPLLAPRVPDRTIWPLLEHLRLTASRQLGLVGRPVCRFDVYQGDTPPPAVACCECQLPGDNTGQGAAWIRVAIATGAGPAGQARGAAGCAEGEITLTLELGVYRCAPQHVDAGELPDTAAIDAYSAGIYLDMLALHRAVICDDLVREKQYAVTSMTTHGPRGGCVAAIVQATVRVQNCCPIVLALNWRPDPADPLAVFISVAGMGDAGVTLDYGDGTSVDLHRAGEIRHVYGSPGARTVTATDRQATDTSTSTAVTVKAAGVQPVVFRDSDDPWAVQLWLTAGPGGPDGDTYEVAWGDGASSTIDTSAVLGRVQHVYRHVGHWRIAVTDTATRRTTDVVAATGELGLSITYAAAEQPRAVVAGLAAGAAWEIDLADGQIPQSGTVDLSGTVTAVSAATPATGVTQARMITAREIVNGAVRRAVQQFAITPDPQQWALAAAFDWSRDSDGTLVDVLAGDARTDCVIDWGDGSDPIATSVEVPAASHLYSGDWPDDGLLLTIGENPATLPVAQQPRSFALRIGRPRYIGIPMQLTAERLAVQLDIAGVDAAAGGDWYRVDWGDGTGPDDYAAGGRWSIAQHTYAVPGTYTVTVDSPGLDELVVRTARVVAYPPTPLLFVAQVDDGGRTVEVTCDVAARVWFGDGSPPQDVPAAGTIAHTYPAPAGETASHWIVAEAAADPSASDRQLVTVPFTAQLPAAQLPAAQLLASPRGVGLGADARRAELLVLGAAATVPLVVDWGDQRHGCVLLGRPAQHTYTDDGEYTITVEHIDGRGRNTVQLELPWPDVVDAGPP